MYSILLSLHALFKWFVLLSLLFATGRALMQYWSRAIYTKTDNAIRHWTATIAHIQLVLGMAVYFQSPIVSLAFAGDPPAAAGLPSGGDSLFFAFVHSLLMFTAVVLITVGSAMAKRRSGSRQKFGTMFIYFALALLIILAAIPWPFSPLAQRPFIRPF